MVVQELLAFESVRAAGVWPSSDVNTRPAGLSLVGVQVKSSSLNYAGQTVTGKLQGSNNQTEWTDCTDGTAAFAANGASFMGGTDQLVTVQGFKYLRFVVTESGATSDGSSVTFILVGDYEA